MIYHQSKARKMRSILQSMEKTSRLYRTIRGRILSSPWLQIDDAVRDAIQSDKPVVALESTIIALGIPYPQNLELSLTVNQILKDKGVQPATIAIKNGVCRIGLSQEEIDDLAKAGGSKRAQKCSTRDLATLMSKHHLYPNQTGCNAQAFPSGNNDDTSDLIECIQNIDGGASANQWGATTVASTMRLAHMAGIATFVTGGIGGVHRYGEVTLDVSADLKELAHTPVIVVSAGIKSILDIPRTLEVLETYGIPTIGYQTDEFPAFFSPHSGLPAPIRMENPREIALAYRIACELNLMHGFLVAVPNKDPAGDYVEEAITEALKEASVTGIRGNAVTPYVLRRVAEKTGGASVNSNLALVARNASVGADIAIALSEQKQTKSCYFIERISSNKKTKLGVRSSDPHIVVLGGAVLDTVAKPLGNNKLLLHTSNPAKFHESDGGVARNIAEVLGRLGASPVLYSAVGNDPRGKGLIERLMGCGISISDATIAVVDGERSATVCAVLNEKGDLHVACADTGIFDKINPPPKEELEQADLLVIDANPSLITLRKTAVLAHSVGLKIFFEPTSVSKAAAVGQDSTIMSTLTYASPNLDELASMAGGWDLFAAHSDNMRIAEKFEIVERIAELVIKRMSEAEAHLIVTCAEYGVVLVTRTAKEDKISIQRFPAQEGVDVVNATGAGDTLAGVFIYSVLNGKAPGEAVKIGIEAASLSLRHVEAAISPLLTTFTYRKYEK